MKTIVIRDCLFCVFLLRSNPLSLLVMNKKEQFNLLNELLVYIKAFEELEPHFTQRRRIEELEEQIKKLK